jgi:hypothetical protein
VAPEDHQQGRRNRRKDRRRHELISGALIFHSFLKETAHNDIGGPRPPGSGITARGGLIPRGDGVVYMLLQHAPRAWPAARGLLRREHQPRAWPAARGPPRRGQISKRGLEADVRDIQGHLWQQEPNQLTTTTCCSEQLV